MNKLEVGQYWHDIKYGDEFLVKEELTDGSFNCECVRTGKTAWYSGEIVKWHYDEFILLDFILGRHPDNIEQWQLKEGDLVWNKVQEFKAKVVQGLKGELYYLAFDDYGCERMYSGIQRIKNLFEPYTGQDKKIDFSKSHQWLSDGDSIVKTCGKQFPKTFGGHYLGQHNTPPCEFRIHDNWQLLTHEQMQPLLDAIEAITESQND